ncbi:hypothetical protein SAMN05192563_101339 [Paraburkholderia aspalathi]|uniref:Uncharacterized protein n=1 Tax=Paraburkholderia aspalathi TaxID=1324617 RepID=A0A1I7E1K1_9BURK|nr:hypothetical protein SAMN05192563_101339 [Paraburkholderia aspalathi]
MKIRNVRRTGGQMATMIDIGKQKAIKTRRGVRQRCCYRGCRAYDTHSSEEIQCFQGAGWFHWA